MYKITQRLALICLLFLVLPNTALALEPIEITTIDPYATPYGTFGSYNQHVVHNQHGIFITYKKTQENDQDLGIWRMYLSRDGGKTFFSLGEAKTNSKPPALETDKHGNVYLASGGDNPQLCAYRPVDNYVNPTCVNIPNSSSGKFALAYDHVRQQLYYFSHYAVFSIFDTNLNLKKSYQFGAPFAGPSASYQYPLLTLDEVGNLYAAWTTVKNGAYLYHSIHSVKSLDGGESWQKLDGTPLNTPIPPDEAGPTDRITLNDEYDVHTWLKQLFVKNNKLYFPYTAQFTTPRYHFSRYDLTTGKKDQDVPWNGPTLDLSELHGFCASKSVDPTYPIYCASRGTNNNLNVVVSYDQGKSWHDHGTGKDQGDYNIWSTGGYREITSDGHLIGTYTNLHQDGTSQVRFFKIKAPKLSQNKPGDLNADNMVNLLDFNLLITNFGNPYTILDFNILLANYGQ